tara:strand:+ start:214 stop:462 length:249 start_codon:yes stop_codon:yes gene_type:complete
MSFEDAIKLCKSYSNEVAFDENARAVRVVLNILNNEDLSERLAELGFVERTNYTLGTDRCCVVYESDYNDSDTFGNEEAPYD